MHKTTFVIAALLAACFTLSGADAAKKRAVAKKPAVAADPIAEWNKKNMPAMQQPAMWVDPTAKPARKVARAKVAKKAMKPAKRAAKKK